MNELLNHIFIPPISFIIIEYEKDTRLHDLLLKDITEITEIKMNRFQFLNNDFYFAIFESTRERINVRISYMGSCTHDSITFKQLWNFLCKTKRTLISIENFISFSQNAYLIQNKKSLRAILRVEILKPYIQQLLLEDIALRKKD